jgi:hypothetical protein
VSKDWGTYRKLFELLSPDFERLPHQARCFAADILRRCDRNGRIVPAIQLSPKLVTDVAFHVRAHTGEESFILLALEELLKDGYLVFDSGYLTIRNFVDAQRSDSAIRMAKLRARDGEVEGVSVPDDETDIQRDPLTEGDACASRDESSNPSYHLVSSGLVSSDSNPDPEKQRKTDKPGSPRTRRAKNPDSIPVPLPETFEPSASQVSALAEKHGVSSDRIASVVKEFRWFWLEGPGAVKKQRSTMRGWAQSFGNRVDFLAKRGDLYAEHSAPRAFGPRGPVAASPKQPNSGWKPRMG